MLIMISYLMSTAYAQVSTKSDETIKDFAAKVSEAAEESVAKAAKLQHKLDNMLCEEGGYLDSSAQYLTAMSADDLSFMNPLDKKIVKMRIIQASRRMIIMRSLILARQENDADYLKHYNELNDAEFASRSLEQAYKIDLSTLSDATQRARMKKLIAKFDEVLGFYVSLSPDLIKQALAATATNNRQPKK